MSRHSLFTIFSLLLWSAHGSQVNVTVDDSVSSIVYAPSTSWNSSKIVCSSCDNPPVLIALQETYHKGVHVVAPDVDDAPSSSSSAPPVPSPSAGGAETDDDNDHGTDDNKKSNRRGVHLSRLDADDPGFVGTPVFAQFNFIGTAVYIYCIQPLGLTVFPAPPSLMNVTLSIDNTSLSTFVHQGTAAGSGFASGVNVFAKMGLTDGPHALQLNLAPNSALILDYIVVTQNVPDSSSVVAAETIQPLVTQSVSQSSSPSSTSTTDGGTTKKDRATFAGTLGGVLGVLGTICFGTAISIYRRRKLAARRERRERGDAPPATMLGPATFVPRYFPGTVAHNTPPPYAPSDASSVSSHHASQVGASEPLLLQSDQRAYTDAAGDDVAPPSFGVAITTPAVTILSGSDVENPPPRPHSWGVAPHLVALPESIEPSVRTPSHHSAEDNHV
ncbi:hypothetical protein DFH07DRAFT_1064075 [Mycena maculata]|uniref:Transmembrane protein n=1 Tax=Mycena maculata TaxID=230809 RepID=A0AAD7N107_9AGAR|nr:hypothetical protein DFH07DRAFT_1064075 [Mycena maculata]